MYISFEHVRKEYTSRKGTILAVEDISFSIEEGEFVSVLGASGCGKSTLLMMLAGLIPYSGGRIIVDGKIVTSPQTNLGIVFQKPVLLEWRTVLQNILLQAEVRRLPITSLQERAMHLLEVTGLRSFADKMPYELSGGMQQRASICRALVHDPPVLLMDEPFGALDALTREQMTRLLERIWQEARKTVLVITHSISEAVLLSDKIVVLSPRPSRVEEIIPIDLERPRSNKNHRTVEYAEYIRNIFTKQGVL